MRMLPVSEIFLISTFLQGLIYGFALFMFLITVFMLVRDPRRRRVSYGMIAASCILMLLATMEFMTNVVRLVRGHTLIGPELPYGPEQFFSSLSEPTFVIKACLYPVQILILDGVVIYRAYVAWQNYYVVIVPGLGWLGHFACTIGLHHGIISNSEHPGSVLAIRDIGRWTKAIYGTTLATNFTATGLLAYRIWRINRTSSAFGASTRLGIVFRVVVESGTLYTILNLATLISFCARSQAVYYLRDIVIAANDVYRFNMIVVRVGFATTRKLSVLGIESTRPIPPPKLAGMGGNRTRRGSDLGFRSLTVELTQILDADPEIIDERDTTIGEGPSQTMAGTTGGVIDDAASLSL